VDKFLRERLKLYIKLDLTVGDLTRKKNNLVAKRIAKAKIPHTISSATVNLTSF
jgi:hypothetical protein